MTSFRVGATYSAGVTFFLPDGVWAELQPLPADSIWQHHIVRETQRWVTVGSEDEDAILHILGDLRQWREAKRLSNDLIYRRWEIETCTQSSTFLVSVGHGIWLKTPYFVCLPCLGAINSAVKTNALRPRTRRSPQRRRRPSTRSTRSRISGSRRRPR